MFFLNDRNIWNFFLYWLFLSHSLCGLEQILMIHPPLSLSLFFSLASRNRSWKLLSRGGLRQKCLFRSPTSLFILFSQITDPLFFSLFFSFSLSSSLPLWNTFLWSLSFACIRILQPSLINAINSLPAAQISGNEGVFECFPSSL